MEPADSPCRDDSVTSPRPCFVFRHAPKVLALVPFACLLWLVSRYGVDVPSWDQWDLVPLVDKMYRGELACSDLWAQHNEHRPLFPQLIMLGLARLTAWNTRYEQGANVVLAVGVFAVLVCQIRNTRRALAANGLRWAIPAASLIVFSASQYQNWLWGWQIQMVLNLLAVVGGIALLSAPVFRWRRFAGAVLLGIVASYSFANGALFWPIGLAVLLVVTRGRKERTAGISAWLVASLLTMGSYLWRYQKPADHPALSSVFGDPLEYASYVLKFVGNLGAQYYTGPLLGQQGDGNLAFITGLLGLVSLAWAGGMVVWRRLAGLKVLLPYFAMTAYSIGTAMMTGIGRVGFGSDQALESRYGTMVVPFWVSLVVFLLLLMQHGRQSAEPASVRRQQGEGLEYYRTLAAGALLASALILVGLSSLGARSGAACLSEVQAYCRTVLVDLAAHPGVEIDYSRLESQGPYAAKLVERYPALVRHRVSVFRPGS